MNWYGVYTEAIIKHYAHEDFIVNNACDVWYHSERYGFRGWHRHRHFYHGSSYRGMRLVCVLSHGLRLKMRRSWWGVPIKNDADLHVPLCGALGLSLLLFTSSQWKLIFQLTIKAVSLSPWSSIIVVSIHGTSPWGIALRWNIMRICQVHFK